VGEGRYVTPTEERREGEGSTATKQQQAVAGDYLYAMFIDSRSQHGDRGAQIAGLPRVVVVGDRDHVHPHRRQRPISPVSFNCSTMFWRLPASVRSLAFTPHRQYSSTRTPEPLRILFCGSDNFSIASLRALVDAKRHVPELIQSIDVLHRPGKPTGRGLKTVREGRSTLYSFININ
jgi:hypothetical protein